MSSSELLDSGIKLLSEYYWTIRYTDFAWGFQHPLMIVEQARRQNKADRFGLLFYALQLHAVFLNKLPKHLKSITLMRPMPAQKKATTLSTPPYLPMTTALVPSPSSLLCSRTQKHVQTSEPYTAPPPPISP